MKKEKNTEAFSVFSHTDNERGENGEELVIGEDEVRTALSVLEKYRAARMNLEKRIRENEQWYRMRHWEQLRPPEQRERKQSAWLFNSLLNKHADFMDAIPECTVLPRENSDYPAAEKLTSVLPVILERNDWESVYSDAAFNKLKNGTAVFSVLWDPGAAGGLGDISIKQTDILNVFWEPGIRDIQKSRNIFCTELWDNDLLVEKYPFLEEKLGGVFPDVSGYVYDESVDTSGKSTVVDWYYKKNVNGKTVLHYCKFTGSNVLYASENDPELRERGWYDHSLYPFVFDPLFREEGTPVGFGYIDIMKGAQEEIDVLGAEIMRNARLSARRRYFTRTEGAVNEEEFADMTKDFVHVSGSSLGEDSIREISESPLSSIYVTVLNNKIQELKETTGTRDFVTGSTTGGVTSGVAITALQEAGNKLSRDMISATYRAFARICELSIELIRQFYTVPRSMRILGEGGEWSFCSYDNSELLPTMPELEFGVDFGSRSPVFDVSVKAHKQNAFSRSAQNTDALNFYKLGFFDPARSTESLACLQLLDIDNKEKIMHLIEENGRKAAALPAQNGALFPSPAKANADILRMAAKRGDISP